MQIYGYVRVSTHDQNEDRQLDALHEIGVAPQYADRQLIAEKIAQKPLLALPFWSISFSFFGGKNISTYSFTGIFASRNIGFFGICTDSASQNSGVVGSEIIKPSRPYLPQKSIVSS